MDKQLLYQNKKINYRIAGKGKPVILIHGFGEEATVWNNQIEFLKEKFQLIIPDLPGSGQSDMIADMSMEGMAETIHAIIHEENIESCPVIGHSMGGYVVLALMESYWNHVSAFGLFHSSAFADSDEKKVTRRKGIEFIKEHGAFEFLKTATPNLFSSFTKDENPGLIDQQVASLDKFTPAALIAYYEAMMQRPDRTDILRNTSVPVLFLMGKYDVAVPMEDGLKQCHLPGKSYIHILRRSGHMGMLEEVENSNQILENFLNETYTPGVDRK
ncbi:MAG: alpha/beta hydrolase [Bacteroidota bacterium]